MGQRHAEHDLEWTDASAYAPLLRIERSGFAWEWLRRQPAYQSQARLALDGGDARRKREDERALRWNLHAFEDPGLEAPKARPVWTARAHPWVVKAIAERCARDEDSLDLEQLSPLATLVASEDAERLLLSDGYRSVRLDIGGRRIARGPVRLSFELSGVRALERPLLVLRRLRALVLGGRFRPSLHPGVRRAQRLVKLLRTHDAIRAGASQADVAQVILRQGLEQFRWRVHSPSIRSQAQRLVAAARQMNNGGFWRLLD